MSSASNVSVSILLFVGIFVSVFAAGCPELSTDCTELEGGILCGKIGPDCTGSAYGSVMIAWKCTSGEGCTCYCPYQDKCGGTQCLPSSCEGDILNTDSYCNPDDGKCYFRHWEYCKFGCDSLLGKCTEYVPEICANTCGVGEIQKPFPGCACEKMTCDEGYKLVADQCVYQTCDYGYALVEDRCVPACNPDDCAESCQGSIYNSAYKFKRGCVDNVCTDKEDPVTCYLGCKMDTGKAHCIEECDNGADDDDDGLKDCKDPECFDSLYCKCKPVTTHTGSPGEKVMKVLIGGYYYPATNESYNYKDRDEATMETAQKMAAALSTIAPLNTLNYEFYVTRFAPTSWMLTGSSVVTQCADVAKGGDFTFLVNFNKDSDSYSYRYSMGATVYRVGLDFPEFWVGSETAHEFAHGFGGLWDEYETSTIDVWKGYPASIVEESSQNCAMVATQAECQAYFSTFGVPFTCVQSCSSPGWWRSSDQSIMRYNFQTNEFNAVSKVILSKRIDMYLHPEKYRVTLDQAEKNLRARGINTRQLAYVR